MSRYVWRRATGKGSRAHPWLVLDQGAPLGCSTVASCTHEGDAARVAVALEMAQELCEAGLDRRDLHRMAQEIGRP